MNKLLFTLSIAVAMSFLATAYADQRFETAGGYSHFVVDPNNADNEVYFSNCVSTIETANNIALGTTKCVIPDQAIVPWVKYGIGIADAREFISAFRSQDPYADLNGDGDVNLSDYSIYRNLLDDVEELNVVAFTGNTVATDCDMVTSNYDAGNDDWNQTEYSTNTWNSLYYAMREEDQGGYTIVYKVVCSNGIAQ